MDTSNTWFRDCYQDAGIPCVFQVFSPFQPLHTPVTPLPPPRADDGGLVEVSQMLARHTERQAAGRGAVARYYQGGRG